MSQRGTLCALRVICSGTCPWDWVRLLRRTGCQEHIRALLCTGEVHFAFLSPGDYLLTLCASRRRLDLWVYLSPGSTVECRLHPGSSQFRWRALSCRCVYPDPR